MLSLYIHHFCSVLYLCFYAFTAHTPFCFSFMLSQHIHHFVFYLCFHSTCAILFFIHAFTAHASFYFLCFHCTYTILFLCFHYIHHFYFIFMLSQYIYQLCFIFWTPFLFCSIFMLLFFIYDFKRIEHSLLLLIFKYYSANDSQNSI